MINFFKPYSTSSFLRPRSRKFNDVMLISNLLKQYDDDLVYKLFGVADSDFRINEDSFYDVFQILIGERNLCISALFPLYFIYFAGDYIRNNKRQISESPLKPIINLGLLFHIMMTCNGIQAIKGVIQIITTPLGIINRTISLVGYVAIDSIIEYTFKQHRDLCEQKLIEDALKQNRQVFKQHEKQDPFEFINLLPHNNIPAFRMFETKFEAVCLNLNALRHKEMGFLNLMRTIASFSLVNKAFYLYLNSVECEYDILNSNNISGDVIVTHIFNYLFLIPVEDAKKIYGMAIKSHSNFWLECKYCENRKKAIEDKKNQQLLLEPV